MTKLDVNQLTDFKLNYFKALQGKDVYALKVPQEKEELIKAIATFKTPKRWILQRKGPNDRVLDYVPGGLVKRALNVLFGLNWAFDFEIIEWNIEGATIKASLTVFTPTREVTRSDIGGKENQKSKKTGEWIHSKNDLLKAAVTDGIKRTAALYGLFLDLWIETEKKGELAIEKELKELTTVDFIRQYVGMILNLDPKEHSTKIGATIDLLSILADVDQANATVYLGYKKLLEHKLHTNPNKGKLVKKETK